MHRLRENLKLVTLVARTVNERTGGHGSREQQNAALRIDRFELNSEVHAVQHWHHHIGDKEVRTSRLGGEQCLQGLSECHCVETASSKNESERRGNDLFIIDDERQTFRSWHVIKIALKMVEFAIL